MLLILIVAYSMEQVGILEGTVNLSVLKGWRYQLHRSSADVNVVFLFKESFG